MNTPTKAFVSGFILTAVVLILVVIILSRPSPLPPQPEVKILTQEDLQESSQLSQGLENYGSLPFTITGDQIGRGNPFESY